MKKIYTRANMLIVLLMLLIGIVIYSCRKDKQENATETAIFNPQLLQAKQWYESNYNSSNTHLPNGLTTQSTSTTLPPSWDNLFSPAWTKAITFVIDSITYFELPVVKTHGDFAISRNDIGNTKFDYSKSMSRSSIILRKSNIGYTAYLMTILADSAYLNGDFSKLANNNYLKKDENFSGLVFFHTLNGKFNNGWRYNSGKITGTISQGQSTVNSDKAVQGMKTLGCESSVTYSYETVCSVSSASGVSDATCTQYTEAKWSTVCDAMSYSPDPSMNGGGSNGGISDPLQAAPPEGFRPLCKSSIVLTPSTGNTNQVNMTGIKFGITDLPTLYNLYQTQTNVIQFNLQVTIPSQIRDPSNPNNNVNFTIAQQQEFIYQAFHWASEQVNARHGQDFFSAGAQPIYSSQFASYVQAYLNTMALGGMFPAYENANGIPSIGARTSTSVDPSKATPAVFTTGPSGQGC